MTLHTDDDITELAKKAGITPEDMDFMAELMPRLFIGHALGVRLFKPDDMKRILVMYEKLQEVDPDAVPPEVKEALKFVAAAAKGE